MKRGREKQVIEGAVIESVAAEGKSLFRYDNRVIFVPLAVPGDVVDVRILRKRKSYWEGQLLKIVKPSPDRKEPFCPHFGVCGGCKWQMLPYQLQLEFKSKQAVEQLVRIGGLKLPEIEPILGAEKTEDYRNKLEFTFSHRRWFEPEELKPGITMEDEPALGFHVRGMFDKVVDVKECRLQKDPSNQIRNAVREFTIKHDFGYYRLRDHRGEIRNLIIRTTSSGSVMVIVVFAKDPGEKEKALMDFLVESFPSIASVFYMVNTKLNDAIADLDPVLYYGKDHLLEEINELKFRISPKSFFQTNTYQTGALYRRVKEMAGLTGTETVYDLYSGTGTIGLYLAGQAEKVVGIETVSDAVEDARLNAEINDIRNAVFVTGDVKDLLDNKFVEDYGEPDVVILDPPRSGLHPLVVGVLNQVLPERIVYVSCNPATQARDLSIMSDEYEITAVQPVDMFPHTHHLENIVVLHRKGT